MKTFKKLIDEVKKKMAKCQGFKCGKMVPESELQETWGKMLCKNCRKKNAKSVVGKKNKFGSY